MENNKLNKEPSLIVALTIKTAVWGILFLGLYLLRSFFLLIFLTFVFAYLQANGVERLSSKIKSRTTRVVFIGLFLLTTLFGIGAFIVPPVKEQSKIFVDRFPTYISKADKEILRLNSKYPVLSEIIPQLNEFASTYDNNKPDAECDLHKSLTFHVLQQVLGFSDSESNQEGVLQTVKAVRNIGAYLLATGSAFFLSLLFSFLIVLDLPKLTASVVGLKNTSLSLVYHEVADGIYNFCGVLGRALQAQLYIALLNTFLTALGIMAIGLGNKVAFLSLIVFLCSFIPVAGVFISSTPICLVALQESGPMLMFLTILLIIIIHFIETYILNPRIYGYHMRLNPVIVLIILTIGGKLFGIWGLVLGVPVCTYIFSHAIRANKS